MTDAPESFLSALAPEQRQRLMASTHRKKFQRGEVIFHEGDPGDTLHVIDKGYVAIRVSTPLGDIATLTILAAGEAFGEQALIDPRTRRTATAVALEATETRTLSRDDFDGLRRSHPSIDRMLIEVLAAQVRRLSEHLLEALYVPADKRVLRRLHALGNTYGDGDGIAVIPLTQDDLATMAGTTRPTANRVLKEAEAAGLVVVSRGKVEITDAEGLASRAR